MEQSNRSWIIRDTTGRIDGPFTAEKILYKIGRGEFSGEESISTYPDGKWIPISQEPEFYDRLLEVISNQDVQKTNHQTEVPDYTKQDSSQPQKPKVEIVNTRSGVFRETTSGGGARSNSGFGTATGADEQTSSRSHTKTGDPVGKGHSKEDATESGKRKSKSKRRKKKPEDIELVDTRNEVWAAILKKARLPVFVVIAAVALASMFLVTRDKTEERLHLLAPQKGVAQAAPETLKPRLRQGTLNFLKDTLEGYLKAQNDFISVVERDPKNSEAMAMLCMTYLQLWPYTYQDTNDSKTVAGMMQLSTQADPGGVNAATCRTVDLIVRARYQEAKSLVEALLDSKVNENQPPVLFYYLKGELLEGVGDHESAIGYLRSAQQLWPQWLLPYMIEAQAQSKVERYADSARLYTFILKSNPGHDAARIELGILEYKQFNHVDLGEKLLRQALDNEQATRAVLSRGHLGLAEIALKRSDGARALKEAQKSYTLNPSNTTAKNMIVQLGGKEKLQGTKVKGQQLIIEGDQFFREGDCHAAQAHYKAAFEEDQKNALAAIKAAQCLWKLSFSTEAMDWLNRAIRADPKQIDAYVLLADYQSQRFNFLAASRVLEQGKRINPKSGEVYRGFALIELRRGNPKGALLFGKEALKLYETDVETLILLAETALALKDPTMAYNYSSKGIEIDANNRKAQIVHARSIAALQGVDAGVDYFLRLVNNYPLVLEYRLALGQLQLADERYQQAGEIFRQIIKLQDKPKEALIELAKVMKAEGEPAEALDLLLKAAVLDPADAEPLFMAGNIYLELKKPQEASVQFNRVLTINKLYPLVYYQLGRTAMTMNDPKAALRFTEEEKKANPNLAEAFMLAAEAHTIMQQYSLCATEYQKAIKLRQQPATTYVKLAQCNRKSGNLDAAMAMLAVASQRESGLADIYKEQGAIYELKGDVNHAIESYNQYFVLDPDAPDRVQIEGRISALQRGLKP